MAVVRTGDKRWCHKRRVSTCVRHDSVGERKPIKELVGRLSEASEQFIPRLAGDSGGHVVIGAGVDGPGSKPFSHGQVFADPDFVVGKWFPFDDRNEEKRHPLAKREPDGCRRH